MRFHDVFPKNVEGEEENLRTRRTCALYPSLRFFIAFLNFQVFPLLRAPGFIGMPRKLKTAARHPEYQEYQAGALKTGGI
ncbi:MAG: hypothetical protein LBU43_02295 [Candidatus Accumulibacter sp.]|jgi:hypothetical protein|nr:hypothetical protein [Accumulibacter sp.]